MMRAVLPKEVFMDAVKVDRCYFLSLSAKQVFRHIFILADQKEYFTEETVAIELGLDQQSVHRAIEELISAEILSMRDKTLHIRNPQDSPLLIHAEIIHQIKQEVGSKFFACLKAYKTSRLCDDASQHPEQYADRVREFFLTDEGNRESSQAVSRKPSFFHDTGVSRSKSPDGAAKERKIKRYDQLPVEEWGSQQFCDYYSYLYQKRMKRPYLLSLKDLKQMKRLLGAGLERGELRRRIEFFISSSLFEVKTIAIFCSAYVQSRLDGITLSQTADEYEEIFEKNRKEFIGDLNSDSPRSYMKNEEV